MDKKITTLVALGGDICPPELFWKNRQRGVPQNYIGHGVCFISALSTKSKVLYTREKYQTISLKIFICIQGEDGSPSPSWAQRIHLPQQIRLSHRSAFILKL